MKTKFVIGIDGGGTKTHAVIADMEGNVIAEHTAGPSNFQIIGVPKAARTIFSLMKECAVSAECGMNQIHSTVLGLTGAGRTADQNRMADGLKKYAVGKKVKLNKVIVESDARIALEGAFKGKPGIILIAGTGSIVFGKDSLGTIHRVGGWGRLLGDEGGGYFLGHLGMIAVVHQLDGRGDPTLLTKLVAKKYGLSDQTSIIREVYNNAFDVASIAPLVLEAASQNDVICRMIIEQAAIELTKHIRVMTRKLETTENTDVHSKVELSLIGGLMSETSILREIFVKYIEVNYPHVQIIPPMSSPAYGAVVMALQK